MAVAPDLDLPSNTESLTENKRCELCEEDASQGYKSGHMRYVLGVGLGMAALAMVIMVVAFSAA